MRCRALLASIAALVLAACSSSSLSQLGQSQPEQFIKWCEEQQWEGAAGMVNAMQTNPAPEDATLKADASAVYPAIGTRVGQAQSVIAVAAATGQGTVVNQKAQDALKRVFADCGSSP